MGDKRRILVLDYGLCNFHNLRILTESGHKVFVINTIPENPHRAPIEYYKSLGITLLDDPEVTQRESIQEKFIEDNGIDTVINSWPTYGLSPDSFKGLDYIGLSIESSKLEVQKLWTREMMEHLGVDVPRILRELQVPCVVKPVEAMGRNGESASICLSEHHLNWVRDNQPNYYIEEYIPDAIEANVEFVISGGRWSIYDTQQVLGEDTAKMAGGFTHWTRFAGYKRLSEENEKLTRDTAKTILDWAVTLGGDYLGQITGLIKDGKWYFCEINVRPEQSNSLPYFITGDEWLDAMHGSPDIIGDSYGKVQKVILQPSSKDVPYPFHLHEKYGVSIPCGIDIIAGKHRLSHQFRNRAKDGCIGIIVVDRHIPQEFIDEVENNSKYFVSHCFLQGSCCKNKLTKLAQAVTMYM